MGGWGGGGGRGGGGGGRGRERGRGREKERDWLNITDCRFKKGLGQEYTHEYH